MKHKSSFVYVFYFLYRFGFLLWVIPLRDVIFEQLPPKIAIYIYRSDICALGVLLLWAIVSCRQIFLLSTDKEFLVQKGVFFVRKTVFPKKSMHILRISQSLFLRLFKACKAELLSSFAGSALYLPKTACKKICKPPAKLYRRSNLLSLFVFSLTFSTSLTGLLSLVPLLRNIASLLGEKQTQTILSYADLWVTIGFTAAPPFLRVASTLIFFSWLLGGLNRFFHFYGLSLNHTSNSVLLCHGLINRHCLQINKNAICAIAQRQSILLRLAGLCTPEAYVSHKKEHKIPLIPAVRKGDCMKLAEELRFISSGNKFTKATPPQNTLWGYTWKPLLLIFLLSVTSISLDFFTSFYTEPHLLAFLTLWAMVWFLFSLASHRHSALLTSKTCIIIRSTKGLSFVEAIVPVNKITCVRITQNVFQKRKGVCHLYVHIPSSGKQYFLIRHIHKDKTAQLTRA